MKRVVSSCCFLLIFYVSSSPGATVQLKNIRVWAAPDNTRVVFDLSSPVRHDLEILKSPFRVVIDMENTRPPGRLAQPPARDRFLRGIRSGRHGSSLRIVLDLKKYSRVKSFLLQPNRHYGHRLVVDVFGEKEKPASPPRQVTAKQASPAGFRDIVVAVDAGHGGEDPGATGPGRTHEKTVVLQIAKKLSRIINRQRGMRAVLIRQGDYFLSLRKRIRLARQHKADLFISIHADAFHNPRVRGSSVYVLSRGKASSEHARWLAKRENAADLIGGVSLDDKDSLLASVLLDLSQTASLEDSIEAAERILDGLGKIGKLHKPRVGFAGFAVLTSPDIPSLLVETAFISNPREEKKLRSAAWQQQLAQAIAGAIKEYFVAFPPGGALLAARQHVIARGDTLSEIARHYRVSLRSLRSLNDLSGDRIEVGQVLTIPGVSGG